MTWHDVELSNECDDDYQSKVEEPIIPNLTYTKGYRLVVTTTRARYVRLSTGVVP